MEHEPALDPGLTALDTELAVAGAQARRALHGRTQPTRVYSVGLRNWLLERLGAAATAPREHRAS
jgi:hypothetical protein